MCSWQYGIVIYLHFKKDSGTKKERKKCDKREEEEQRGEKESKDFLILEIKKETVGLLKVGYQYISFDVRK